MEDCPYCKGVETVSVQYTLLKYLTEVDLYFEYPNIYHYCDNCEATWQTEEDKGYTYGAFTSVAERIGMNDVC